MTITITITGEDDAHLTWLASEPRKLKRLIEKDLLLGPDEEVTITVQEDESC